MVEKKKKKKHKNEKEKKNGITMKMNKKLCDNYGRWKNVTIVCCVNEQVPSRTFRWERERERERERENDSCTPFLILHYSYLPQFFDSRFWSFTAHLPHSHFHFALKHSRLKWGKREKSKERKESDNFLIYLSIASFVHTNKPLLSVGDKKIKENRRQKEKDFGETVRGKERERKT